MKRILKCSLCFIFLPFLALTQDYGGEDKFTCSGGTTNIGTPTPCQECCYKWYPTSGLDNPNSSNPKVSGLSESTIYSVTVSLPSGDYVEDYVTVYVYSMQMSIFKPLFMTGGNEVVVPDAEKKSKGAQTMVNIDNDDCDDKFDNTDNSVVGGDDEFIKIRVTMNVDLPGFAASNAENRSPLQYVAKVFLADNSSATGVKFWKSADKSAGEFFLGSSELNLEAAGGTSYQGFIWAEGTDGHNAQRLTQLKAKASSDNTPLCMNEDIVSLTVLAVKSIEWEGIENGYTGNGKNNSNTLDDSPIASGAPNKRVFPEKKYVSGTTLTDVKDIVKLKVTLSTTPVDPFVLYFRPFDIDDPSVETAFIDPNDLGASNSYTGNAGLNYTADDDNRGTVGYLFANTQQVVTKYGHFTSSGIFATSPTSGVYSKSINASSFSLDYKISKFPGDNFRVAVYGDKDFISQLRNRDQYDQYKIVDKCTGVNAGCKEIDLKYMSPILTSFRTLHIEVDGMKRADVVGIANQNNDTRNVFLTNFERTILNGQTGITKVSDLVDLSGTFVNPNDGSGGNGRFEGGTIIVAGNTFSKKIELTDSDDVYLKKSGSNYPNIFVGLNCTLSNTNPSVTLTINILDIEKSATSEFFVKIPSTASLVNFTNAKASIGGGPQFQIYLLPLGDPDRLKKFRIEKLKIPVQLKDDDYIEALPYDLVTDPDGVIAQSFIQSAFKDAYMDSVVDGGGNPNNNKKDQGTFLINLTDSNAAGEVQGYFTDYAESKNLETTLNVDGYWVAYLFMGWQTIKSLDGDPNAEGTHLGVTGITNLDCEVSGGTDVSFIPISSVFDIGGVESLGNIVTHELGHQFGLTHILFKDSHPNLGCAICAPNQCEKPSIKIMHHIFDANETSFGNFQLGLLRSRSKSPKTN
jgi:hypothetical protein